MLLGNEAAGDGQPWCEARQILGLRPWALQVPVAPDMVLC